MLKKDWLHFFFKKGCLVSLESTTKNSIIISYQNSICTQTQGRGEVMKQDTKELVRVY